MVRVGIDDISVYIPRLFIDSSDLAISRGLDPEKLKKGLGVETIAITDSNQDPACLAANAVLDILQKNDIRPSDVGRLYVATESSIDESKALNSYVIGMLEQVYGNGSFEHCGGIEAKFACVSGAYSLYDNTNWIRAGEHDGKLAVVVTSAIAKYDIRSSAEATQGAGAVAMLVGENPRLLAFDDKVTSSSIKNEYDFYRPFGKETPIVFGHYSDLLYLIQVRKAWDIWKDRAIKRGVIDVGEGESVLDKVGMINTHIPYSTKGIKVMAYLMRHELRNLPEKWEQVISQVGIPEPQMTDPNGTIESIMRDKEFMEKDHEFNKRLTKTPIFHSYNRKLSGSLIYSSMTGNLYTGSMFLAMSSNIWDMYSKGVDMEGMKAVNIAYGSGSSSMVMSGDIQPRYKEIAPGLDINRRLKEMRNKICIEEYEKLHLGKLSPSQSIREKLGIKLDYGREFVLKEINKIGQRVYRIAA